MENNTSKNDTIEFIADSTLTLPPCFGEHFFSKSDICQACRAPVIVKNRVRLLREVCQGVCSSQNTTARFKNLKSRDVEKFLEQNETVQEIFDRMVLPETTKEDAKEARRKLMSRLRYLEKTRNMITPDVPSLDELFSQPS